jgi:hypothetical protein
MAGGWSVMMDAVKVPGGSRVVYDMTSKAAGDSGMGL